jgi:hypothetical protein
MKSASQRRRTNLSELLDCNARRLDQLGSRRAVVAIDGAAVIEFVFERVLASATASEFTLKWARNVSGLLDELEAHASVPRCTRSADR